MQLPDYNTGFLELRQGTVDAVVVDVGVGNYQIANTEGDYVILSEPVSVEQYAVGFYLGNEALRDAVNEQLLAMAEDGTMMSIAEKYVDTGLSLDCLGLSMFYDPRIDTPGGLRFRVSAPTCLRKGSIR